MTEQASATAAYMTGFGNEFATEALAGALPLGRNSPQRVAHGLYAEQFSGTAFTAPREATRRSWLYRIRPGAVHGSFRPLEHDAFHNRFEEVPASPNRWRWSPLPAPPAGTDFIDGLVTIAGNGSPAARHGIGIHQYLANRDMEGRWFYNADAEMMLVPQAGRLRVATDMGVLEIEPQQIAVIPRGVRFAVTLPDGSARGFVGENFGPHLRLPELGVLGTNGLANPRDFEYPAAAFEDIDGDFTLLAKYQGRLWQAPIGHSPLDVVAWHGTNAPYRYDLRRFNTIGSISFDHPDPSIFCLLTSPSGLPGVANIDVAIFPPRWLVGTDTFRPAWFHRNVASEFMGLIHGVYDAKDAGAGGFVPGGMSLHNCMTAHGPDRASFDAGSSVDTSVPQQLTDTMAFMFETQLAIHPTRQALESPALQDDYDACWLDLEKHFRAPG